MYLEGYWFDFIIKGKVVELDLVNCILGGEV